MLDPICLSGEATPRARPAKLQYLVATPCRLARPRRPIEQTLFFRFLGLVIVANYIPYVVVAIHGLVGLLPIMGLALFVGMAQGRLGEFLHLLGRGFVANRPLVLLYLWYACGVSLNSMIRGNGLADWRLMVGPWVEAGIVLFALALFQNDRRSRWVQVALGLSWGVEALLSVPAILSGDVVVREAIAAGSGAWEFGNQGVFAAVTMVLPVMGWRALRERGILRASLLVSFALTVTVVMTSTFATPVGLLGVGLGAALLLSPGIGRRANPLRQRMLVVAMLVGLGIIGYQVVLKLPQLDIARVRLQRAVLDPRSGGYEGVEQEESRWLLGGISVRSFLAEPIFGSGGGNTRYSPAVGGHSSLLDSLGAYGLLGGGGALAAVVGCLFLRLGREFHRWRSWETLMSVTAVVLLVVGGITNPYWEGGQIPLVVLMAGPLLRLPAGRRNGDWREPRRR